MATFFLKVKKHLTVFILREEKLPFKYKQEKNEYSKKDIK